MLYSFGDDDANFPVDSLIGDSGGNFYGTGSLGDLDGWGAIFKLAQNGAESVSYSFSGGSDGSLPLGGVVMDKKGNFYGTTLEGGAGFGTVSRLSPGGTKTTLHSFASGSEGDGSSSSCALIVDGKGGLYGTIGGGGVEGGGTVFKLSAKGSETILHSFAGGSDGAGSYAVKYRKRKWLLWQAMWEDADGKKHGSRFFVSTHGERQAKALAVATRRDGMAKLHGGLTRRGAIYD